MSDRKTELHNRLANEFVTKAMREVLATGGGYADVMVLLESTILAGMLITAKLFDLKEHVATELVESAVHRATERFVEQQGGK